MAQPLQPAELELQERFKNYQFYHSIRLTENVTTPGLQIHESAQELALRFLRSLPLAGKRVLDIGCRDGLFCFEAEKLGASEVIGIDNSLSTAAIELIIPHLRSHVRMYERNLYDLRKEEIGLFDVICMPGVLYHLRYPIYGLAVLRDLLHDRGYLLIETAVAVFEEQVPLLYCPFGNEGPYFPDLTSVSFFNLKGLTQTLASMGMELQRAEYLHAPSAVPDKPFSSLRKFFARRKPPFPRIDRCCLLCRKNKAPLDDVDLAYWEGTHTFQLG